MSYRNGRDRLWLIWKEPVTRSQYMVGEMEKNGDFSFRYCDDINDLLEKGFQPLMPFPDTNEVYRSPVLFPIFSSRLPDRRRPDISDILTKYDLSEYDEYLLLKASGARLPIDSFAFIDPIFPDETDEINRNFFVAGVRHYLGCSSNNCCVSDTLKKGARLTLAPEPENGFDASAIRLFAEDQRLIGYIPRYYCPALLHYLQSGREISCEVIDCSEERQCEICIRARLDVRNGGDR